MKKEQWQMIKDVIGRKNDAIPFAAIVDSPWIPGYCGVGNLDFYMRPDVWTDCYKRIRADFPQMVFLPDWWVEYAMTTETSGFGCRFSFYDDNLPTIGHIYESADDCEGIETLTPPDPRKDGLMPMVLNLQKYMRPRLADMGEDTRMVCTRGPLTVGSYLLGVTEFLVLAKIDPDAFHKLMRVTTTLCKNWLEAQMEAVGTAEAIMVLDDVCGFFSPEDYLQFAHPYIKEIFGAFPEKLHFFHNDMETDCCVPYLTLAGVDVFNPTHLQKISHLREIAGEKLTLLGNLAPMSLKERSPEEAADMARAVLDDYRAAQPDCKGLIFSLGGGMPMGARKPQLDAVIGALADFNARH